jgi:hypothetical protein
MEKRSRRRTRDLVTQAASQGLSENEIGCARISMMARSTNAPCKGRIQMRKTNPLHLFTFGLQRTAGPYKWVRHHCNLSCKIVCLSAIIAVTDRISPTPPILTGIGTLAWHRTSIWRCRPTPLKSFLPNTEVSIRLFVVSQIPAPSFPKKNILSRPVFGTRKRCRIRTRIPSLAELFKMNARLVRALRRDIQPSARRVG